MTSDGPSPFWPITARDPLNFFSPYERLPAGHENQLTRAMLLLLRMSPLGHVEWLRLVDSERSLRSLPSASYNTQKRVVRFADEGAEQAELISVFLTPEQPQHGSGDVAESDRGQVLDAIVDYGGVLITVIENKIFDAGADQAQRINLNDAGVQLVDGQRVIVVLWRDLLEALSGLRERDLVGGAEAAVLDDFLTYVENHFPGLGPFRNLALCRRIPSRLERRLRQCIGEAAGTEGERSPYGPRAHTPAGTIAGRDAYLTPRDGEIELELCPADTLSQAKELYGRPGAVAGLRALLTSNSWRANPNFHFGFTARGYCWTSSSIAIDEYLDLWNDEIATTRTVPRSEWDSYWTWLLEKGIASDTDRPEFDRHFTASARQTATPRPGVSLARRWSFAEAETLDSKGLFVAAVRDALNEALVAVREPPIPA